MAEALSGEELSVLARALLAELEGGRAVRVSEAAEGSAASEASRLTDAVERLSACVERFGTPAESGADMAAAAPEDEGAYLTLRSEPESANAQSVRTTDAGAPGSAPGPGRFRRFSPEVGTAAPDLEKWSELIRRDSRRCDAGFERY
jgi:hypothetical protein